MQLMKLGDKSFISIVIPTYGRDAVLVDSIRQLLALAVPADELLVIDQTLEHDEETEKRLSGWDAEGRIRWIRHQPPGHVGGLNRGLHDSSTFSLDTLPLIEAPCTV